MTDELHPAEGITRRDMLKRSAVVGGASAMVWAAPSLTTFSARAFGDDGTPISDLSNFGALVKCTDYSVEPAKVSYYRIAVEAKGDWPNLNLQWVDPGKLGGCEQFVEAFGKDWDEAEKKIGSALGFTFTAGANVILYAPDDKDCVFDVGAGFGSSLKQGQCCLPGVTAEDGKSIKWTGPFPNGTTMDCDEYPGGVSLK
jgi:hypothetical protein